MCAHVWSVRSFLLFAILGSSVILWLLMLLHPHISAMYYSCWSKIIPHGACKGHRKKVVVHSSLLKKSSKIGDRDIGAVNRGFELEKEQRKSHYSELTAHWMRLKMDPQSLISSCSNWDRVLSWQRTDKMRAPSQLTWIWSVPAPNKPVIFLANHQWWTLYESHTSITITIELNKIY